MLSWPRFWRHLGTIGKKETPSVNWTLDKDTQDIVDGIAGVMNIIRQLWFVSISNYERYGRRMRDLSHFWAKHPIVDQGAKFFNSVLIPVL